jgi:hypothetical protein
MTGIAGSLKRLDKTSASLGQEIGSVLECFDRAASDCHESVDVTDG